MSQAVTTLVWVKHIVPGFHNWPDAPEPRKYLAAPHRHLFHFKVGVEVGLAEHDRGIEFHDLLDEVRAQVGTGVCQFGAQSCEMLALALAEAIRKWLLVNDLGLRPIVVDVSEDGECGAIVQLG